LLVVTKPGAGRFFINAKKINYVKYREGIAGSEGWSFIAELTNTYHE
jgi:hypothetical protein